ncbi:hypothetical protein [Seonamhaeicola aphaedonensis]|uniref:Glycosyl hydrolase family 32 n=1 Tax=Seonamhaeicola aphaedonensis TaxID=1461338 RepID=A0A3D9HFX2_9FLAO|nr:hypothetical protein [Seonamhaeicola aphaedonensis]RED48378.1 hypothetical protein DFQ02_104224 [Seonamhaeicola aphaedonensis]
MTYIKSKWEKKGLIFKPKGNLDWSLTHAQVPFAHLINDDILRIFYSTRDKHSCSSVSFIDVDPGDPSNIKYVHKLPVLQKGKRGSFDDSGTMPSWFLNHENKLYMYYTAWNKSIDASYRLSIGLAVSEDNGFSFEKLFRGPILDRNMYDPIWVGQPCVLKEEGVWKMWYLCCEKIEVINNIPEPFYNVKYAESNDGVNWLRENRVCIDFDFGNIDAIGRPCVFKDEGIYKMYHSNRKALGYRENKEAAYSIGYSESEDGMYWKRLDDLAGIEKSDVGWDSLMNEYCTTYLFNGVRYLIYNGNGFGESGFGYAVLRK